MPKRCWHNSPLSIVRPTAAVQDGDSTLPELSEKTTDTSSAPTHTQPGGFIGGTGSFFGAGRSTAAISGLICQLGPNFWAVEKRNRQRLLYTTFGIETPHPGAGKAGRETFQLTPKVDVRRTLQRGAAVNLPDTARCQTSHSWGFHREPFASKLASTVVRRKLATGSVKGLCTTSTPSCRQTAGPGLSPAGLYTTNGIHARRLTRPVSPPLRPTPATPPVATLRSESQKYRIPSLRSPRLALVARQNVYALVDVAAVTTLIKYPNRGTLE
jgi:hypothetical protein